MQINLLGEVQGKKKVVVKKLARAPQYVSPNQLILEGFETPFAQKLYKDNRWIKMSNNIPWDRIVNIYNTKCVHEGGRPPISGRIILGALMIKHLCNISDRETILQIQENPYLQYFIGYPAFTNEAPFDHSLFVTIRERLSLDLLNQINDIIISVAFKIDGEEKIDLYNKEEKEKEENDNDWEEKNNQTGEKIELSKGSIERHGEQDISTSVDIPLLPNKGKLLMDATACPQNITHPTDIKLLNASRVKSEEFIDLLHNVQLHGNIKVRTYRKVARKQFLNYVRKKRHSQSEIRKTIKQQLRYLKRNLDHIKILTIKYPFGIPLKKKQKAYLETITKVYDQQQKMIDDRVHTIENRIVNIHQPQVRPIVRGKLNAVVEFGSKIQTSLVDGYTTIDRLSWDAFNEGTALKESVEKYTKRFGFYPKEVLADQIYCNRENRKYLKERNIKLVGKPLGRPSAKAVVDHIRPGERNPIEGKFGQAKVRYGMNCIKAKLKNTSESWIATIAVVLNLVRLARVALQYLYSKISNMKIREINLYKYQSLWFYRLQIA